MTTTPPLIINLFGGPGTGKSTIASGIFCLLKLHGVNTEYVTEFPKDLTWEESYKTLLDQYYITAVQRHRFWRLIGKVDVIVTDAPFLLGLIYGKTNDYFKQSMLKIFNDYNNINYLLNRTVKYIKSGRNQIEQEAQEIDKKVLRMLSNNNIHYTTITGDYNCINEISSTVLKKLNVDQIYSILN